MQKSTINLRIKEERKRLKLTQQAFAAVAGAGKRTVIDWEKGVSYPNAEYLWRMHEAGANVNYIVTGMTQALPVDDASKQDKLTAEMVKLFEQSSPSMKKAVMGLLKAR